MTIRSKIEQYVKEQKIGQHVSEHKDLYVGIGVGAGIVGVVMLALSGRHTTDAATKVTMRSFNLLSHGSGNIVSVIEREGRGFPVWCIETGEWFKSQNAAAKAKGISDTSLSQHLNGLRDEVSGLHFVRPVNT